MVTANTLKLNTAVTIAVADIATATPADSPGPNVFHYEQRRLANSRVALEPFDPALHLGDAVKKFKDRPDLLAYMPFPPLDDEDAFVRNVWSYIRSSPAEALYAVRDLLSAPSTPGQEPVAGFVTLSGTNPVNASTELGIILFPEFHHTHVSANAVGLMLQWLMDPMASDSDDDGTGCAGLGLRRVEWKTHADNVASRKLAERVGFHLEGICRWERIVQPGKPGVAADRLRQRNGSPTEPQGQHMALYSIVWDEWDQKRPLVVAAMERDM